MQQAQTGVASLGQVVASLILALLVLGVLVAWLDSRGWLGFLWKGQDTRGSTSKVTALAWTVVVGFAFLFVSALSILVTRPLFAALIGGGLADQYLILLGGPFVALVAAKMVPSDLVPGAQVEVVVDPGWGEASDPRTMPVAAP